MTGGDVRASAESFARKVSDVKREAEATEATRFQLDLLDGLLVSLLMKRFDAVEKLRILRESIGASTVRPDRERIIRAHAASVDRRLDTVFEAIIEAGKLDPDPGRSDHEVEPDLDAEEPLESGP